MLEREWVWLGGCHGDERDYPVLRQLRVKRGVGQVSKKGTFLCVVMEIFIFIQML